MKIKLILLALLLTLIAPPITAEDREQTPRDFPTQTALQQTVIPALSASAVAGRLRGVDVAALPPPDVPETRALGDVETFWASNSGTFDTFEITAELRAFAPNVYIWVEQGAPISYAQAESIGIAFDWRIYPQTLALWDHQPVAGLDGETAVHILFAYGLGAGTGAYFAQRHTYPEEVVGNSNQRNMFFVNLSAYGADINSPTMESTLAHELQHMIHFYVNPNQDTWLNEGFSTFTEYYLGYDSPHRYPRFFFSDTGNQLNTFGLVGTNRAADYGAAFMFVTYFYHRYGLSALQTLGEQTANGLRAVAATLDAIGAEEDVDALFGDWVLANLIQRDDFADGRYSYPDDLPLGGLFPTALMTGDGVATVSTAGNQYSARYYQMDALADADELQIHLDMAQTVQLVPVDAFAGDWMWYGNRADGSNTTLTRAFDLRDVDSATLEFQTWYAIEELWDYAYIVASADGGKTWDFLTTLQMTDDDPFGNNYGVGYTGYSDGWIAQSIALDDYVGDEVLVRFKYVTDDAVNEEGIVIDAVAVPEIDYYADFNADDGGWVADGWVRVDNVLPQSAWVAVVEYDADNAPVNVTRWQFPTGDTWRVLLHEQTARAVIVVAPFAPVTTIPADYTLSVSAE
ncbi:MAG: hypothetical protein EA396_08280 [Anaerolineaceae bacterium]|nr:MAG: hypothetical protein EA396_08280 [Anaerolineaceae bacterium]